jgi:hypothetical protein
LTPFGKPFRIAPLSRPAGAASGDVTGGEAIA